MHHHPLDRHTYLYRQCYCMLLHSIYIKWPWNESNIFFSLFCIVCPCVCAHYSILGMHLFGCKFGLRQDSGDTLPDRKNFDSLLWATVTVFQVRQAHRHALSVAQILTYRCLTGVNLPIDQYVSNSKQQAAAVTSSGIPPLLHLLSGVLTVIFFCNQI